MKIFFLDFIKSDPWFHILKFFSYGNLSNPKTIGETLKASQVKFWKEALFLQYYKSNNVNLISDPIPIKYVPDVTKVLHSLISPSIKEYYYSDAWKFVAYHCKMGVLIFKVLVLISPTFMCHILIPSTSTLL